MEQVRSLKFHTCSDGTVRVLPLVCKATEQR